MKILFLGRNCKVGGGCTFRYRASQGLIGQGHDVSLAAQGGPMATEFQKVGVHFKKVLPTPLNRWQLLWLLKRQKFDVVHACNSTAGDDMAWVARKLGKNGPAWVMSVHGNLPDYVTGNACLREALEVMTFDQSALDRLHKIEWMRERHVHMMPRPVERRDIKVGPATPPRITMVSRLSKTKGPAAMATIEAVERLQGEFPGLSLTIYGDGSAHEAIVARAKELNEKLGREAVTAPGKVTDPFVAMADSACVVGTSYVAFEALFHSIPVVAAGYEGFGLVDKNNLDQAVACNFGDGFPGLHPEVTADFMTDGLRRALTHFATPEGRAELEEMRQRLEANHSLQSVAKRLEHIYQLAIEKKQAS